MAKLRGQRMVLCSLLGECLPVIDALMHTQQSDYSDEYLNRLLSRAGDALKAIAEDQVKGVSREPIARRRSQMLWAGY